MLERAALPAGFSARRPAEGDVDGVVELVRECETADTGAAELTGEDVSVAWRTMDTEHDAWLVVDAGGRPVATAALRHRHPSLMFAFAAVAPRERGLGIGTHLLSVVEERAREVMTEAPAEMKVTLGQRVGQYNEGARKLLEANGYAWVRRFWRMRIELDEQPPAPEWPDGVRPATMRPDDERRVFEALEEAFQDHWRFTPHEYGHWRAWNIERESFDASLWFLAWDGDEIGGASCCAVREGEAWVNELGVRRPWRRRGVGLALLRQSFGEFYRRGLETGVLEVDSENPTGATRLYERAGMHVVRQSDTYEKVLREATG
jgi:mycothiol synthase